MNEMHEVTKNLREIREAVELIKSLAEDRERWAVSVNDVGETLADSLMSAAEAVEQLSSGLERLGTTLADEGAEVANRMVEFRRTAEDLIRQLTKAIDSRSPDVDLSAEIEQIAELLKASDKRIADLANSMGPVVTAQSSIKAQLDKLQSRQNELERNVRLIVSDEVERSSKRIIGSVEAVADLLAEMEAERKQRNPFRRLISGGQSEED